MCVVPAAGAVAVAAGELLGVIGSSGDDEADYEDTVRDEGQLPALIYQRGAP